MRSVNKNAGSVAIAACCAALLCAGSDSAAAGAHGKKAPPMPIPPDISPAAQDYYRNVRPRSPVPLDVRNPKVMSFTRDFLAKVFLANTERLGIAHTLERIESDDVEAWWVRIDGQRDDKVLIYLHGGGMILGSAKTNLAAPLRIAQTSGYSVLSVEYRLAPENPFPAALDDALAAYVWLLDNGWRATDIGVFGDSAGGNLALAMPLLARDRELPIPAALVLLSPSVDRTRSGDTYVTMAAFDPVLGAPSAEVYAGDHALDHPLVSPLFADLAGMPPMLIQVGTRERLLSDSVRLAQRARRAEVDVTLDVWDGMWHVWQDSPDIPEAERAADEIGAFFRAHLANDGPMSSRTR